MLNDTTQGDAIRRRAIAITQAAERGERLTRQLLTFSRRQMLRPEPVDLRRHVDEIADMLSPALRPDIEVKVEIPGELWPVFVDSAEFQMALLNVGMNARDAMPESGRFWVGARNVTFDIGDPTSGGLVGDFVAVTLSDTGAGMARKWWRGRSSPISRQRRSGWDRGSAFPRSMASPSRAAAPYRS